MFQGGKSGPEINMIMVGSNCDYDEACGAWCSSAWFVAAWHLRELRELEWRQQVAVVN